MPSRPSRTIAALCAALLLATAACGSDDDESSGGEEGGTTTSLAPQAGGLLSFGITLESIGYQPATSLWDPPGYIVASSFFDRLTAYDENGEIRPYLAESIESNDDFTEWTITLRPGVEFHDGTPLDAEALQIHFENMIASAIWGPAIAPISEMEVVDDLTLALTMDSPFSTFPHALSAQPGFVAAPSQYADPDGARNPVGTGPFVFEDWEIGEVLTVRRNENYWREGAPLLDGIEFRVLSDSTLRREALENGDVDIMETNAAADIADLEETGEFQVFLDTEGESTEMTALLNEGRLPFEDQRARQAVAFGIDRQAIADNVYGGRFDSANGPFRPGSIWYQDVAFPSLDTDRAVELAGEYEAEHGEPIAFTIEISEDPLELKVAQEIESQLEALGMEVTVDTVPAQQTTIDVAFGNYDMNVTNLLWGSQHPDREYFTLHSDNALPVGELAMSITRMQNETLDAALEETRLTDDVEEQIAQWKIVQEQLADESNFVFLVHNEAGEIAANRVHDITDWTFPDGTPGRSQEQTILSLYQIWIDQ